MLSRGFFLSGTMQITLRLNPRGIIHAPSLWSPDPEKANSSERIQPINGSANPSALLAVVAWLPYLWATTSDFEEGTMWGQCVRPNHPGVQPATVSAIGCYVSLRILYGASLRVAERPTSIPSHRRRRGPKSRAQGRSRSQFLRFSGIRTLTRPRAK